MTQYSRGADFERKVKLDLATHAWSVTRAAGSHGMWDLVAVSPGPTVVYIQCKRDAKLSKEDRTNLITHCLAFNCVPVLAYKDGKDIKYLELFLGAPMEWHP
jgi:Holliday junction resolvase